MRDRGSLLRRLKIWVCKHRYYLLNGKDNCDKLIHTLIEQMFTGKELEEIVMQGRLSSDRIYLKSIYFRKALKHQK